MGEINNEKRNALQLEERNDPFDKQKKEQNEKFDIVDRPMPRPIPDVIPRFPSELNLHEYGFCDDFMGGNDKSAPFDAIDRNVGMSERIEQAGGNVFLPQLNVIPPNYVHPPYIRMPMVDPMYYPDENPSHNAFGVIKSPDVNYNQYKSKPGSVYGIPHDSRPIQNDYRANRHFKFVLRPDPFRAFNGKSFQNQALDQFEAKPKCESQNLSQQNMPVHLGGLLTLPKSHQSMSDESSQSSSSSSRADDESTKIAITLPGMVEFKKLAYSGCKDLEKLIAKFNVKSAKVDLEGFCRALKTNLINANPGLFQIEPVLREIILAYLHISSSWVSLASLLPVSKDQPNPLDSTLEPLCEEFQQWQEVSKTMLEKITVALQAIPNEHERYISGIYKKDVHPKSEMTETANYTNLSMDTTKMMRIPQYNPTSIGINPLKMCEENISSKLSLNKGINSNLKEWEKTLNTTIIYPKQFGKNKPNDAGKTSHHSVPFQK